MEDNNYYRPDLFCLVLEKFLEFSPVVTAAALVGADGFAFASAGDSKDIENLDALSAIALNVIERVRANSAFEVNEVILTDGDNKRVICRYFTNDGAMSEDYILVLHYLRLYGDDRVDILVGKLKKALEDFY
ncbi:MAG: hypothetical protein GY771_13200 [bacterium]|nr:hypothetical protein [bacterium]